MAELEPSQCRGWEGCCLSQVGVFMRHRETTTLAERLRHVIRHGARARLQERQRERRAALELFAEALVIDNVRHVRGEEVQAVILQVRRVIVSRSRQELANVGGTQHVARRNLTQLLEWLEQVLVRQRDQVDQLL
jgi:hypothetical protein